MALISRYGELIPAPLIALGSELSPELRGQLPCVCLHEAQQPGLSNSPPSLLLSLQIPVKQSPWCLSRVSTEATALRSVIKNSLQITSQQIVPFGKAKN